MDISKAETLHKFLIKNIECLEEDGNSGRDPNMPEFELSARDYLAFAEEDLTINTIKSKINCISNLKRAIDCQIDTFLYVYNLYEVFNEGNLKIGKKLDFLEFSGVFTSYSITRLNTIRNKMEHNYIIPNIEDLEVYYDLVFAFISVLESKIMFTLSNERDYYLDDDNLNDLRRFCISYNIDEASIEVTYHISDKSEGALEVSIKDYYQFAYFFRVFFLLSCMVGYKKNHVVSKLNEGINLLREAKEQKSKKNNLKK